MQIWYDLGIYVFWGFFNQILGHVYRNQLYMIVVGRMELFRTVWVQIHILYIYIEFFVLFFRWRNIHWSFPCPSAWRNR